MCLENRLEAWPQTWNHSFLGSGIICLILYVYLCICIPRCFFNNEHIIRKIRDYIIRKIRNLCLSWYEVRLKCIWESKKYNFISREIIWPFVRWRLAVGQRQTLEGGLDSAGGCQLCPLAEGSPWADTHPGRRACLLVWPALVDSDTGILLL